MRRSVLAASLLLTTSASTLAGNLDALRDSLDHLPATIFVQEHGDLAYFVDVQALTALAQSNDGQMPGTRLMLGADMNGLETLLRSERSDWEAKSGTSLDQLRYFTSYGRPPNGVSIWGLSDEAAASDLIASLETQGFEPFGETGVVGNGEPMAAALDMRDPTDPWRTRIGAAQFAALKGSTVVQTGTPQSAMLVAVDQPAIGQNEIVQMAVAGLGEAVGEGSIMQAVVISPFFGMAGLDPAAFISPSASVEEMREQAEQQMAALSEGIPPYLGGIIADVQHDSPGATIALAYPDCAMAEQAAEAVAQRWEETSGGNITTGTVEGESGLCAATINAITSADAPEHNPSYRSLIEPFVRGEPGPLQIGES